jgi:xanthine dehydrogenase YagS FAD-binding subunit
MHPFEYIHATSLSMAMKLLKGSGIEALAGGTDLLGELKRRIRHPGRLLNLKTISGLDEIHFNQGLHLGSLVTIAEIEHHPIILKRYPILSQAASLTATPQLRNMGTIAGNLCQHPRCWYYRNELFHCWLKGGEKCFAAKGENKYHAILGGKICHAVHPSDLAPALIALKASVEIVRPGGKKEIPLEGFYVQPSEGHRQMTILRPGELIKGIRVPAPSSTSQNIYLKAMERQAWSFALVSLAAHLNFKAGRITEANLILGGVGPMPWRAKEAEAILKGKKLSEELALRAGETAMIGAKPLYGNTYKIPLAKALIKQSLISILKNKK